MNVLIFLADIELFWQHFTKSWDFELEGILESLNLTFSLKHREKWLFPRCVDELGVSNFEFAVQKPSHTMPCITKSYKSLSALPACHLFEERDQVLLIYDLPRKKAHSQVISARPVDLVRKSASPRKIKGLISCLQCCWRSQKQIYAWNFLSSSVQQNNLN